MIAIEVLDQSHDVNAQSVDECPDLLLLSGRSQKVDHLLNRPRPMHVQTDPHEIASDRIDDGGSLFVGRVLEQLLTEVIAEWIGHEFWEVTVSLSEDHVPLSGIAIFELLLEVSTAVLVFA